MSQPNSTDESLSDKLKGAYGWNDDTLVLEINDVKEAVKKLKEKIWDTEEQNLITKKIIERVENQINEIFGEKLCQE